MTTASAVRGQPWPRLTPDVALADIATAMNSSLGLDEILRTVVRLTCDVLSANRATILLLDEILRLVPKVSHGAVEDPAALARFREMPPIALASIPHALDLIGKTSALPISDVERSELVPAEWIDEFGLKSLLVAPIVADGETLGALVADYVDARHEFTPAEVRTMEGIAACCATAMRNGRLYDEAVRRAQNLDESLRVTADLNAAATSRGVCDVALDGLLRVLVGTRASLHLYADDALVTLASRGGFHPEPGRYPLAGEDRVALAALVDERGGIADAVRHLAPFAQLPDDLPTVLLPLTDAPAPGFVLVTCAELPDDTRWRLARSVAGQVWMALDRARLAEQTQRRFDDLQTIYHLADELALAPDLDTVVARIAGPVRVATGCEAIDVYLCGPRGSERFASRPAGKALSALMRAWRTPPSHPVEHGGLLVVPMVLDGALVGLLRVRQGVEPPGLAEEDFLMAIGAGVASVVSRAELTAKVGEAQRELAVVQERERIARDLHDTLGQTLFGLGLQLAQCEQAAHDPALRASLRQARGATDAAAVQLRQAIHALAFLKGGRLDLVGSLRSLTRELPAGLNAVFQTSGRAVTVEPARAEALLRVAREALVNVEKHALASAVHLELRYRRDAVELTVTDNGTGLGQRASALAASGLHFGLRSMKRRLDEVGGEFSFENVTPHGLRITARVPV
ncbi:MAG TPA: GAF domain-containing protein [Frankiaceae bacterium]|jgi:signal transduction histidine kinase|nr:GAF domain-containing protein [Frankiaceae bacterium]